VQPSLRAADATGARKKRRPFAVLETASMPSGGLNRQVSDIDRAPLPERKFPFRMMALSNGLPASL